MKQTTEQLPYVGSTAVRSRYGPGSAPRSIVHRSGFTLIEVVVATAILIIAVLTLMVSYYGYYARVQQLEISTVGDNLAQLQMEDILSKSKAQLLNLCQSNDNGQAMVDDPNYYNKPDVSSWAGIEPPVVFDHNGSNFVYDTGYPGDPSTPRVGDEELPVEGTFYIRQVTSIDGQTPSSPSAVPTNLNLPEGSVDISVVSRTSGGYEYNVILEKNAFPGFKKRVRIEDMTKNGAVAVTDRIFRIDVTVYWEFGGRESSRTLTSEK